MTEIDPGSPRLPDQLPFVVDDPRALPPPAERWLLVLTPTEVGGESGEVVRIAEAGQWMAAVETREGWVRVATDEEGAPVRWVRLDERVQIVVRERGL